MLLRFCLLFLCLGYALADLEWWKSSIMYQIYPRSFADSDGDGNGDLKGILKHADYLKDIGVGIVWLSPIYNSPMMDMGYDVSDFKDVNPLFGTLADAQTLIDELHKRGLKVFMDMVPNHSSDMHPWFNASRNRVGDEKDYYVWKKPIAWDGSTPIPPNNWLSMFKGKAWSYDKVRQEFYLHQFGEFQPDLNYRNKKVIDAMYNNMKFWLDKGVDGFRMDAVPYLVEDDRFLDEPVIPNCDGDNCLSHIYTQNQPDTYKVLQEWEDRILMDYGHSKFIFYEAYANQEQTMKYYYKDSSPFNFLLITNFTLSTNATELRKTVDSYMKNIPKGMWPNWVIGNHDNSRVGNRLGSDFIDAANMLTLLLPGTSVTFQGEEIGMLDGHVRKSRILDCCGRDPERMPMQWDNTDNAGFSSSTNGTWLPVNTNYWAVNVQAESKDENSHLNIYKRLAALRMELVESTDLTTTNIGEWVFGFMRQNKKSKYYVIVNLNNIEQEVVIKNGFKDIPSKVKVHTPTDNAGFKIGDTVDTTSKITMRPRSAIVVSSSSAVFASFMLVVSSLALLLFKQ